MSDVVVDADMFARSLDALLERFGKNVKHESSSAIEDALDFGSERWSENAKAVLSSSYSRGGWGKVKGVDLYRSGKRKGQVKAIRWYGKTYKTGRYARSIRHQMLTEGDNPSGEIGSPSLPGLAHLLEKGHGYYSARPHPHIEPAAEDTFRQLEKNIEAAIERAIDDA